MLKSISQQPNTVKVLAAQNTEVVSPNSTGENTVYSFIVPGGTIGTNGSLRISTQFTCTNNANTKTLRIKFGGVTLLSTSAVNAAGAVQFLKIANRDSVSAQISGVVASGPSGTITTTSIDTSIAQNIEVTVQKANAGDTLILQSVIIEHLPV